MHTAVRHEQGDATDRGRGPRLDHGWSISVGEVSRSLEHIDSETRSVLSNAELVSRIETRRGQGIKNAIPIDEFLDTLED